MSSPSDERSTGDLRGTVLQASDSLGDIEAEVIRQELKTFHEERLLVATSEERAGIVANLEMKTLPSEDL